MFRQDDLERLARAGGLPTGQIGEHLVCADIMAAGYPAHLASQGSSYDVIAEVGGQMLRIQVKTTVEQKDYARGMFYYGWPVHKTTGSRADYGRDHCDCVAFVALDGPYIAYLAVEYCARTVQMKPPGRPATINQRGISVRCVTSFPFSRYVVEDMK